MVDCGNNMLMFINRLLFASFSTKSSELKNQDLLRKKLAPL